MSMIWIYVMSRVCPSVLLSGWPGHLGWQKLWGWTLQANCSLKFLHTCYAYRHHWLQPFYTTFTDLYLAWVSQGQGKAKPLGFIFLHTFNLIRMKFCVAMKRFKLNIERLLIKGYWKKGNNCCETDLHKTNLTLACIQTFFNWFDWILV